jgi:hypothetical protein
MDQNFASLFKFLKEVSVFSSESDGLAVIKVVTRINFEREMTGELKRINKYRIVNSPFAWLDIQS